ncbi:hypothetical protein VFPBJ_04062 [Purpureocillium lilacinum]|uniref:Uncharacterized protein n=1 Tax=Purpureocillium lilacinum TaxID=33203 RepID=A0A179GVF3_PURLI|nr:hypothetical protein VFPBJ_04062 [Purpureocillium lilacinum]
MPNGAGPWLGSKKLALWYLPQPVDTCSHLYQDAVELAALRTGVATRHCVVSLVGLPTSKVCPATAALFRAASESGRDKRSPLALACCAHLEAQTRACVDRPTTSELEPAWWSVRMANEGPGGARWRPSAARYCAVSDGRQSQCQSELNLCVSITKPGART